MHGFRSQKEFGVVVIDEILEVSVERKDADLKVVMLESKSRKIFGSNEMLEILFRVEIWAVHVGGIGNTAVVVQAVELAEKILRSHGD
jgi:hypothetical protein